MYDAYANVFLSKTSSFDKSGAWADVKAKGRRLVAEGRYRVLEQTTYSLLAEIQGDNDTYIVYVNNNLRINKYENNQMTYWDCTCPWSEWAWTRETLTGRVCSHAYAAHLLLQEGRKRTAMLDRLSKFSSVDDSRVRLAQEAVFDAVAQDLEGFVQYIKNGVAVDTITDTLVEIAVDFQLPVDTLDEIVVQSVQDALASQAQNLEDELSAVEKDISTQIERLALESETIAENEAEEERADQLSELAQKLLQSTPDELLEEMVGNPIPFLANLGVEIPEEDVVALQGLLIQALTPDKQAKRKRSAISWIVDELLQDLLAAYDIEDLKAYFEGAVTPFRDEIFEDIEVHELDAQELEDLERVIAEEFDTPTVRANTKKAGFKKRAGRFFTEDEKLLLINELGTARQFLAGEIRL